MTGCHRPSHAVWYVGYGRHMALVTLAEYVVEGDPSTLSRHIRVLITIQWMQIALQKEKAA